MINVCVLLLLCFGTWYGSSSVRIFGGKDNMKRRKQTRAPSLQQCIKPGVVFRQSDSKCWNISHSNYSKLKCTIFIQICIYLMSESLTVTVPMLIFTWLIFAAPDVKSAWVNILAEKGQSSRILYGVYMRRGFS